MPYTPARWVADAIITLIGVLAIFRFVTSWF